MKRILPLFLGLALLAGCAAEAAQPAGPTRYEASFLTLFDTVTTVVGYAHSEEEFRTTAQDFHDELLEYHQLYDIYNDYDGVVNLKTINDSAGGAPVEVDQRIIDLLLFCQSLYGETDGAVNVAMGSLLSLWHDARESGVEDPTSASLPSPGSLSAAAEHMDVSSIDIDSNASTVRLTDPEARLDVGAVAKGYAVEQVCQNAPTGLLVSVGGNVRSTGPKPIDNSPWVVGIQSPDGPKDDYLHTVYVRNLSVVSSGDYQRYYTVDGVRYHHIIDPATGYPAHRWRAVTVLCADSGLADALSTALFTLSMEEGLALLERSSAHGMWVDQEGALHYSPGFSQYIRT